MAVGCLAGAAPETGRLPADVAAAARRCRRPGWTGGREQVYRCQLDGRRPGRLSVYGLGPPEELDAARLAEWLRRVAADAGAEGQRELLVTLPPHPVTRGESALRVLSQLALLGYRFDRHRSRPLEGSLRVVRVVPPPGEEASYRLALRSAAAVAEGTALARDLANSPPNLATPEWMAAQASELAGAHDLEIEVLGPEEMERRGMGGLLAVGGGSVHPPRLVRLSLGDGPRSVALVGKGVTFDTGGISIKPASKMSDMKYDKAGACTVLGVVRAAAELRLPLNLSAYLPLAENMLDGASYRPADIVRCYDGTTVEVLNTDAEGRMILADTIAWAAEERPGALLEFSTLTGATVVALGHHGAALYSPDEALAEGLLAAGAASGERLWRMPLWPEFRREMEGLHADLRNVASRWGGANTAAAFLSHFAGGVERWAHLDIAGTAYVGEDQQGSREAVRGATGFGVALTVAWLLEESRRP